MAGLRDHMSSCTRRDSAMQSTRVAGDIVIHRPERERLEEDVLFKRHVG